MHNTAKEAAAIAAASRNSIGIGTDLHRLTGGAVGKIQARNAGGLNGLLPGDRALHKVLGIGDAAGGHGAGINGHRGGVQGSVRQN